MARLLKDILPQPPVQYNQGMLSELVRKLQYILGINIQTEDEAEEIEAVNFFLSN
jgi:hypothetical protein